MNMMGHLVNSTHLQVVAKALGRQGNAHRRLGELDKAKVAFEKALTEHRTPDNKG